MEWIKIVRDDFPSHEVLAANFKRGTYGYKEKCIGWLSICDGVIVCDGESRLEYTTHYININKFDIDE